MGSARSATSSSSSSSSNRQGPARVGPKGGSQMNVHEYQAKSVLREFGVPVPRGHAIYSLSETDGAARELPGPVWVVKSQIHAGGRGKGTFKERDAGEKGGV